MHQSRTPVLPPSRPAATSRTARRESGPPAGGADRRMECPTPQDRSVRLAAAGRRGVRGGACAGHSPPRRARSARRPHPVSPEMAQPAPRTPQAWNTDQKDHHERPARLPPELRGHLLPGTACLPVDQRHETAPPAHRRRSPGVSPCWRLRSDDPDDRPAEAGPSAVASRTNGVSTMNTATTGWPPGDVRVSDAYRDRAI